MAYSWILTGAGIDRGSGTCLFTQGGFKLTSQEIQLCIQIPCETAQHILWIVCMCFLAWRPVFVLPSLSSLGCSEVYFGTVF